MDDLIYGLLVIAWIVYGIYSSAKKNKAKANSASAPETTNTQSKNTIETVFESLFQEKPQKYAEIDSPYYESESVDPTIDSSGYQNEVNDYEEADYLDTVPEAIVESKIDTYSGSDNEESSFVPEEEMDEIQKSAIGSSENDNSYDFDLQQAIIAQAILERPHE